MDFPHLQKGVTSHWPCCLERLGDRRDQRGSASGRQRARHMGRGWRL